MLVDYEIPIKEAPIFTAKIVNSPCSVPPRLYLKCLYYSTVLRSVPAIWYNRASACLAW